MAADARFGGGLASIKTVLIDDSFSKWKNQLSDQLPAPPQLLTNPSSYVGHKGVDLAGGAAPGWARWLTFGGSFCCFCQTNPNNPPPPLTSDQSSVLHWERCQTGSARGRSSAGKELTGPAGSGLFGENINTSDGGGGSEGGVA